MREVGRGWRVEEEEEEEEEVVDRETGALKVAEDDRAMVLGAAVVLLPVEPNSESAPPCSPLLSSFPYFAS